MLDFIIYIQKHIKFAYALTRELCQLIFPHGKGEVLLSLISIRQTLTLRRHHYNFRHSLHARRSDTHNTNVKWFIQAVYIHIRRAGAALVQTSFGFNMNSPMTCRNGETWGECGRGLGKQAADTPTVLSANKTSLCETATTATLDSTNKPQMLTDERHTRHQSYTSFFHKQIWSTISNCLGMIIIIVIKRYENKVMQDLIRGLNKLILKKSKSLGL